MSLPASIPLKRDPPADMAAGATGMDFGGMAGLGLLLIVAVFAWAWWRRRMAGGQATAAAARTSPPWAQWLGAARTRAGITTLASSRLTPRHSVHEVQWQGKRLLIGCAEHSICLLAEVPVADAPAQASTPAPGES